LLFWAVLANDLSSVRERLRTASKDVHRGLTGSCPELSVYAKTTPLELAMGFARWDIVEVLLAAGANPFSLDANGHDALMVAAILGKDQNIRGWLKTYPQWNLERREATIGLTALQWAVAVGGDDKANTIEALLEHGADPLTLDHAGGSVLSCAASNPDFPPKLMQRLLEFGDGKLLPLLTRGASPRAVQWRLVYSVARLLARVGVRNKLVQELATWEGKTPLHIAGVLGHLAVCKVLVRHGAPLGALSAQGLTPLQDTKKSYGGAIPDILEAVLSGQSAPR
jgi:ankyrin repeat protein